MEKNDKIKIKVMNMSSEYYTPFFEERKIKDSWITWGLDNLFPDRLLQLMNKSSKHNAILKTKAAMIGGNGFKKDGLYKLIMLFSLLKTSSDVLHFSKDSPRAFRIFSPNGVFRSSFVGLAT